MLPGRRGWEVGGGGGCIGCFPSGDTSRELGQKAVGLGFFKVRSHLARLPEPDLGGGGAGRQGGGGLGAETTGGSAASDCADGC